MIFDSKFQSSKQDNKAKIVRRKKKHLNSLITSRNYAELSGLDVHSIAYKKLTVRTVCHADSCDVIWVYLSNSVSS